MVSTRPTIIISGTTDNTDFDVTFRITDPNGNVVAVGQVTPDNDGSFVDTFTTTDSNWDESGYYTITAIQGHLATENIRFNFETTNTENLSVSIDNTSFFVGDVLTIQISGAEPNGVVEIEIVTAGQILDQLTFPASDEGELKVPYVIPDNTTSGEYTIKVNDGLDTETATFFVDTKPITTSTVSITTGSASPGCEETNECYIPYSAHVSKGSQVTWVNYDSAAHTVTSGTPADGPNGIFDSSLFMAGAKFSHKFEEHGVYDYFCMVHPWMEGIVVVGEETARTPPPPEPEDHIDLDIWMEDRVYDINTVAVLNVEISENTQTQNIAIDVTDPRDTTIISRSIKLGPNESTTLEFKIDENFKTGNYRVTATTPDDARTEKDTAHFKVKSQFNAFKITSVEVTNQKGSPRI